jgi:[lysine-biosynthesis-protein LysW]---L-2-aminoadipate ligase
VTAIGVLCARVRVEEKQIITALGNAGAVAMPVPPASTPLPPGPAAQDLAALGASDATGNGTGSAPSVLIDRCQNRAVAMAMTQILQGSSVQVIDAGLAASGSRLQVASALAAAGLPRPASLVAFSEASGNLAAANLGYPTTLLPITPGSTTTCLLDKDTAEAVIEHRIVLGNNAEAIILLQAGAPAAGELVRVHVVGGRAIAVDGDVADAGAIRLAEQAAGVLGASLIAVDIARVDDTCVVWDAMPVADFRQSTLLGSTSVAEALAELATTMGRERKTSIAIRAEWETEARHGIVLSA